MKIAYMILGVAIGVGVMILLMNRKQPATQMLSSSASRAMLKAASQSSVLYENEERWNIVRDDSGRISDVVIHRKVEKDAQ